MSLSSLSEALGHLMFVGGEEEERWIGRERRYSASAEMGYQSEHSETGEEDRRRGRSGSPPAPSNTTDRRRSSRPSAILIPEKTISGFGNMRVSALQSMSPVDSPHISAHNPGAFFSSASQNRRTSSTRAVAPIQPQGRQLRLTWAIEKLGRRVGLSKWATILLILLALAGSLELGMLSQGKQIS